MMKILELGISKNRCHPNLLKGLKMENRFKIENQNGPDLLVQ